MAHFGANLKDAFCTPLEHLSRSVLLALVIARELYSRANISIKFLTSVQLQKRPR